jgi:hypothetical protein
MRDFYIDEADATTTLSLKRPKQMTKRNVARTTVLARPRPIHHGNRKGFFQFTMDRLDTVVWHSLTPSVERVYQALCYQHNGWNNGKIMASHDFLASEARVSTKTVQRALPKLMTLGLIKEIVKGKKVYVGGKLRNVVSVWEIGEFGTESNNSAYHIDPRIEWAKLLKVSGYVAPRKRKA